MTTTFTKDVTFDLEIEYNIKATSDVVIKDTGDVVKFDTKSISLCPVQKRKITLSGETLEHMQQEFSYAVAYNLSVEQMLEVIFSDIDMVNELHCGRPPTLTFSNAFGKFILQDDRHWPKGGDSRGYTEKFFNDLNEMADGLGYAPAYEMLAWGRRRRRYPRVAHCSGFNKI